MAIWRLPCRSWPSQSTPLSYKPNTSDAAWFKATVDGFSHGSDQLFPRNGDGHEPRPVGIGIARSRHRDLNRDVAYRDVHDDQIITEINQRLRDIPKDYPK